MQYAISNWIYGNEPLRDQFVRLSTYGYQGIELVGEPSLHAVTEIKGLCKEHDIQVSSILGWSINGIPGRDGASPDEDERSAALEYCKSCVDFASELESKILVVLPAAAGRTAPVGAIESEEDWLTGYQTEWNYAVDSLGKLSDYAKGRGVLLGLEPINRYETFLVYNLDLALRFLKEVESENLKLHLDTFHMNLDEANLADTVRQTGDLLINMHVSDSNREAPGRGHIDFTRLFSALREINYSGYLTLEPVPPGSDPLLMASLSRNKHLRNTYAQEGIEYLQQIEKTVQTPPLP